MRQLRALRVPEDVCQTLRQWAVASPDTLEPLLRLIRAIVFSNAVHRARTAQTRWATGRARDPHYALTPEEPGALQPIRELVDRVVADLERLIAWQFTPPIELHELDANLKPMRRIVSTRLDEGIRDAFETARGALLGVQATLHEVTDRSRGRKATLVQPFRVSAFRARAARPMPARRRDLKRQLRDELFRLHASRKTHPRVARVEAGRLADQIGNSILSPPSRTRPRAGR